MKSRKQKAGAAALGALLALGAWYKIIWTGQTQAIAAAQGKASTALAEAKKSKGEASRLEKLKADPIRAKIEQRLDAAVPDSADLPAYIRWIRSTAEEHRLTVPTIGHGVPSPATGDPAQQTVSNTLFQIPLAVQATGSYVDILEFVHVLETTDRLFVVDSLNLAKSEVAAGSSDPAGTPSVDTTVVGSTMTVSLGARMYTRHGLSTSETAVTTAGQTPGASAASPQTPTTIAGGATP